MSACCSLRASDGPNAAVYDSKWLHMLANRERMWYFSNGDGRWLGMLTTRGVTAWCPSQPSGKAAAAEAFGGARERHNAAVIGLAAGAGTSFIGWGAAQARHSWPALRNVL